MKENHRCLIVPLIAGIILAPVFFLWAADPPAPEETEPDRAQGASLIAHLAPTRGNAARGAAVFTLTSENEVTMTLRVRGLKPNMIHAIHIHEYGDLSSSDGSSAGGHYNPEKNPHGLPPDEKRHAGDLGNLTADSNGEAVVVRVIEDLSLTGDRNPIVGRTVILHAGRDLGVQPAGNAGPRIAAGVIGFANPEFLVSRKTVERSTVWVWREDDDIFERVGDALKTAARSTGRGLEKAAEKTGEAVEKGLEKVGVGIKKTGRAIEKAIE